MKLKFTKSGKQLTEKDTEIEVKNPGILEVPEGKKVNELPQSHFEKLAKKKGLGKITKALNNLQVWNKNDDPELSRWAGNMIDKLNKKLKKDESISKNLKESSSDEYFVGIFKKIPRNDEFGDVETDYYDDMFDFNNYQDAWEEALKWNLKGYYVEFEEWKANEDMPDIKLFKPGEMKKYLNKPLKNEAATKRGRKRSTGSSNSVGSFLDRQIESGKIDEKQVTVVYDKNNNIMWLGKAGFYPLIMSNVEYRSSGYDKDHPHEFWINARSYTEPFEENYKKQLMINESPMDYLDSETRATIDTLERLGYRGTKPMMFDGKPMAYYSKSYLTDRRTSSGVIIYVDPFDGSVEVQEFVNDIDTKDLTDLCPVKQVRNSNDILKIDRWAKQIRAFKDRF